MKFFSAVFQALRKKRTETQNRKNREAEDNKEQTTESPVKTVWSPENIVICVEFSPLLPPAPGMPYPALPNSIPPHMALVGMTDGYFVLRQVNFSDPLKLRLRQDIIGMQSVEDVRGSYLSDTVKVSALTEMEQYYKGHYETISSAKKNMADFLGTKYVHLLTTAYTKGGGVGKVAYRGSETEATIIVYPDNKLFALTILDIPVGRTIKSDTPVLELINMWKLHRGIVEKTANKDLSIARLFVNSMLRGRGMPEPYLPFGNPFDKNGIPSGRAPFRPQGGSPFPM